MNIPYSYLIIPFRFLDATEQTNNWMATLSQTGFNSSDVLEACLDFYLDFAMETGIGVVSEHPILYRHLVIHKNNFDLEDKLTTRLLDNGLSQYKQVVRQTIADMGYVMLSDLEQKLNCFLTASRYPLFGMDTIIAECTRTHVTIGIRYDSTRVRPKKFFINDPTLLPH
mgnify:CR=1 FL=1|jgi:hypothetical protein